MPDQLRADERADRACDRRARGHAIECDRHLKDLTQLVADEIEDAGIEVGDAVSLEVSDNRLSPRSIRRI
jgi:hypothetical protein